jgi:cytochrome d ubiquinol oxidase subunit I
MHGLNTFKYQPVKVAAMEGLWETRKGAPLILFGWPDEEAETTRFSIEIPKLTSFILTRQFDGEVKGLKAWAKEDRPPVACVFWSFRIMVGIGLMMTLTGVSALVLFFKKRLFDSRWFQIWCMAMIPSGFIAVLLGWFVTEIGRQPYIIFGVMRTAEAISPVGIEPVVISLAAFLITYGLVFGAGTYYILRLIRKGPDIEEETYGAHGIKRPPLMTGLVSEKGDPNV